MSLSLLAARGSRLWKKKMASIDAVAIGWTGVVGDGAHLGRGRLRATSADDIRGGGSAAPLGRDRSGGSGSRARRGRGRRRRLRGRLVGRRCLGRGPGGRGVLGGGDALAGAGAGRLAACRDDGWRGEACASVSVAVAGTGDRVGRKKRIPFFLRGAARCRAGTRGVGRGASSDLSHAPRRSSRLPSLGLSLSRRPAGLAPWGAGLGAWGRGDGTGKVSRAVSGWRPRESRWRPSGDDRSRAARSPPLGNARATVDAGALTSFFFAPFLVTSSNFSTAGLGGRGEGRSARVRASGGAPAGAPEAVPAIWFSLERETNHGGRKRAGDRGIGDVPSARLTVNQGIRRRVHVAAVLLEHGDDILLSLAGDRDERLNLVLRHLCLLSV